MQTYPRIRPEQRASGLGKDIQRAVFACLLLAGVISIGGLFGLGRSPAIRQTAVLQGNDDDLTTGSILFVPLVGNGCRQRLIDNATWHIRNGGTVDCHAALSLNSNARPRQWSAARLDVIRDGFIRK